jgi:hypothetical protein
VVVGRPNRNQNQHPNRTNPLVAVAKLGRATNPLKKNLNGKQKR